MFDWPKPRRKNWPNHFQARGLLLARVRPRRVFNRFRGCRGGGGPPPPQRGGGGDRVLAGSSPRASKGGGGGRGRHPHPLCEIPSGCCSFTGPWTVTHSSLRMFRWVAAFCRPLRSVLLLVSFPRSRSPVVGVPGLCWIWHGVPFARQRRPIIGVLRMCWLLPGSPGPLHPLGGAELLQGALVGTRQLPAAR